MPEKPSRIDGRAVNTDADEWRWLADILANVLGRYGIHPVDDGDECPLCFVLRLYREKLADGEKAH